MNEKKEPLDAPPPYEEQPPAGHVAAAAGPAKQSEKRQPPPQPAPGPVNPGAPIKQYEVYRPSSWSPTKLEIKQNGRAILKSRKEGSVFKAPNLHISLDNGQVVAAVALRSFSRNLSLYLGSHPDTNDLSQWIELDCSGWTSGKYGFSFSGSRYTWTRTRQFSFFTGRDFKLVDQQGQVLVIYRFNTSLFKHGRMAEIDYFVELGEQLELLSLAAIMGIELEIERQNNGAAGGAGGGGG